MFYNDVETKFYHNKIPSQGEVVNVIFNEYKNSHIVGKLVDYNGDVIMIHKDITKRRRVRNISRLVQLNKIIHANIESFDDEEKKGSVSIAYLDEIDTIYKNLLNDNIKLSNGIYNICKINNLNFDNMWKEVIFPICIDKYPNDHINHLLNNKDNAKKLLIKFINNNSYDNNIIDQLFDQIIKKCFVDTKIITNKKQIKIISINGVQLIISLLTDVLNHEDIIKNKDHIKILYSSTPTFTIETKLDTSIIDKFINTLITIKKEEAYNNVFINI